MPELPEVETIACQLKDVLVGKKIVKTVVLREKSFVGDPNRIKNKKVEEICRRAKVLQVKFAGIDESLLIHLKMTGQLIWRKGVSQVAGGHPSEDWDVPLPPDSHLFSKSVVRGTSK